VNFIKTFFDDIFFTFHFLKSKKVPHPSSLKKNELIDFSKYYEDEEFFEAAQDYDYPPCEVHLKYAITGTELLVFGSAKVMEEHNVSLSSMQGTNHPAEFMMNVINRLTVVFKVFHTR
jgi:hypothetical protein